MDPRPEVQFDLNRTLQIILKKMVLTIVTLFIIVSFRFVFSELSKQNSRPAALIIFKEIYSPSDPINPFNILLNKDFDTMVRLNRYPIVEIFKALHQNIINAIQLSKSAKLRINEAYVLQVL